MTERYLTAQEGSDRLQGMISVKTLCNWRSLGKDRGPPFRRFGNRILYAEAGFETWALGREFRSTAEYKANVPSPGPSRSSSPSPSQVEDEIEAYWARSLSAPEGMKLDPKSVP